MQSSSHDCSPVHPARRSSISLHHLIELAVRGTIDCLRQQIGAAANLRASVWAALQAALIEPTTRWVERAIKDRRRKDRGCL
jgi:hypothetical protein